MLTSLLNQGSGWVLGRRVPAAARQPPPEHRAVRDLRGRRPPDRASRSATTALFARLCEAIGLPELPDDERFATNTARVAHIDELGDGARGGVQDAARRPLGRASCAPPTSRSGPINDVAEAYAMAEELGLRADPRGRRRPARPARRSATPAPAAAAARRARRRHPGVAQGPIPEALNSSEGSTARGRHPVAVPAVEQDAGALRHPAAAYAADPHAPPEVAAHAHLDAVEPGLDPLADERGVGGDEPVVQAARGRARAGGGGRGPDQGQQDGRDEEAVHASRAASACRIVFGSMKRTSSRMTSNSATSSVPRARKKSTRRVTSSSGALAPERDADHARALEPLVADLALVVDQVRVGAVVARDVDEPLRVRRVAASRSPARGRTRAAICLTAAWRLVVA